MAVAPPLSQNPVENPWQSSYSKEDRAFELVWVEKFVNDAANALEEIGMFPRIRQSVIPIALRGKKAPTRIDFFYVAKTFDSFNTKFKMASKAKTDTNVALIDWITGRAKKLKYEPAKAYVVIGIVLSDKLGYSRVATFLNAIQKDYRKMFFYLKHAVFRYWDFNGLNLYALMSEEKVHWQNYVDVVSSLKKPATALYFDYAVTDFDDTAAYISFLEVLEDVDLETQIKDIINAGHFWGKHSIGKEWGLSKIVNYLDVQHVLYNNNPAKIIQSFTFPCTKIHLILRTFQRLLKRYGTGKGVKVIAQDLINSSREDLSMLKLFFIMRTMYRDHVRSALPKAVLEKLMLKLNKDKRMANRLARELFKTLQLHLSPSVKKIIHPMEGSHIWKDFLDVAYGSNVEQSRMLKILKDIAGQSEGEIAVQGETILTAKMLTDVWEGSLSIV
ncbi:hypothetical protein CCR75_001049 [Bremia lactucae]|uniref:Uncharacterized protein n=1 Tax=Bremia lactucae TaxID=4779 RepID=A0A976FSF0_BRELC|nr:hypothetical protein CCR75_001049 [Bremia lactucae]